MKPKMIPIIIAINLVAFVLLAIFAPQFMISPGKPIQAHAELATDCFACHTAFIGSRANKCIECHKVADIGLKTTKGLAIASEKKNVAFHQKLIEDDCVACHSDHRGVKAFRPISQFSHNLLAVDLKKECASCHSNPGDNLHLKIKGNCGQCHSIEGWLPASFEHEKYFRFDRHHDTDCATCHIDNDYARYTCYGCHEHSRSKIREEHVEEGIYKYENCVECHRSGDEDEAKRIWRSSTGGKGEYKNRKDRHDDDD